MMDKIVSAISLSKKAGKAISGEFSVLENLRAGKLHLVIVSEDSSERTKKKFRDKTAFYKAPYREYGTKEILGHSLGCEARAILGISDENFAKMILREMNKES